MERKIEAYGIGIDSLKELLEDLGEKMGGTVPGYYGVNDQDFEKMWKQIFCDQVMAKGKCEVLDKHFKDCTPEIRAKIFAYHVAMMKAGKVND